jgi:DTW domain-containing protein YfiP
MHTRTRIVLLMHPMELRYQKCTAGRLTCLNLANSEIVPGVGFDGNARVRSLIDDPRNYPVLLYPGEGAMSIRGGGFPASAPCERRLVVFLIDATWHCSRKIVLESPSLMRLPRLTIEPSAPSRFIIKRQPAAWCLPTIEAAGLDVYPDKNRLLDAFDAMQDFQIRQTAKAAVRFSHHVRGLREPL